MRPDFLAAVAWPRLRKISMAFSSSPADSVSAALHSIMPAPVFSLSALIAVAEIAFDITTCLSSSMMTPTRRRGDGATRRGFDQSPIAVFPCRCVAASVYLLFCGLGFAGGFVRRQLCARLAVGSHRRFFAGKGTGDVTFGRHGLGRHALLLAL